MYTIKPVAIVRAKRAVADDDYWGGSTASIELTDDMDVDSLIGLEDFSHAEILFLFNQVDEAKVVDGRTPPAWQYRLAQAWYLRAARQESSESTGQHDCANHFPRRWPAACGRARCD